MNTVKDLRQVLSEEVTRLQPPAGLEARVFHQALRNSAVVVPARRAERRGADRSRDSQSPRLMALVAALLAVAIVLSLAMAARALHLIGAVPAEHGPVGQRLDVKNVDFACSLPATGLDPNTKLFVQVQMPGGLLVSKSTAPADLKLPPALAQDLGAANIQGWNPTNSTYDVQVGQWVPAFPWEISPDGKVWAYATGGITEGAGHHGTVHVVDVANGTDRQVWAGTGGARVLGFLSNGVYFLEGENPTPPVSSYGSIWVVDPAPPNSAHKVGRYPFPDLIGGSEPAFSALGAFALVRDGSTYYDRVESIDLATDKATTWFISPVPTRPVKLLGFDVQGRPIIALDLAVDIERVLLLTGPNSFVEIANGSNEMFRPDSATGDSHGIWFSLPGSIWLYQSGTGLRAVFAVPASLSPTWPSPNPSKFPPGFQFPSPSPTPVGYPSGYALRVIGPCT